MVASRAVVGSSAMMTLGAPEMAMAPNTRCFIPPLIWWGKSCIPAFRRGDADASQRLHGPVEQVAVPPAFVESPAPSTTWLPTVNTGFREVCGSWKIMEIFFAPDMAHLLVRQGDQVLAFQNHLAGDDAGGGPGDDAQQRAGGHGLAAARLAHDSQRLPLAQGEG